MSNIIDELSKIKGVRTYTDEKGVFHMTSISEEEEKRRKEEKLGKYICPECNKRFHWLHDTPEKRICDDCFKKIWDKEESYDGYIVRYSVTCPYCESEVISDTIDTSGDVQEKCNCGAYYKGFNDYDDRGVFFTFFKKK